MKKILAVLLLLNLITPLGYARQVEVNKISVKNTKNAVVEQNILGQKLEKQIANYAGDYSIYVQPLNGGTRYIHNDKAMVSASMIKVFILAKAYEEIEAGRLKETESIKLQGSDIVGGAGNIQSMSPGTRFSVKYLLEQMIVESDNVATNLIIKRLGMAKINKYITAHGYSNTKLQRLMMDFKSQQAGRENFTSVSDLGKIFELIYRGKCVSPQADAKMLTILKGQTDRDMIPAGLPVDIVVAHKTGDLVGVLNDGGIVYTPKGDYVLVVLGNKVDGNATRNIAEISRTVYKTLTAQEDAQRKSKLKAVKPAMINKPVVWNATRVRLAREYAQMHYGMNIDRIVPRAVVLHWTAAGNWEGTYNYFMSPEGNRSQGGRLNVGSHYLVGRDGTIYQLTSETALNRHAIGFNWCAIGVENVGGVDGKEDLTEAQVKANVDMVKYLSGKYLTIRYVFGHYQQDQAKNTDLYIEKVAGYRSEKIDPGPKFMGKVHEALKDTDLIFFKE